MHDPKEFAKADKDHILLPGSIGTNYILNSFALLAEMRQKIAWDTILINIQTLIRNNVSDIDENNEQIIIKVNADIKLLLSYIAEYNSLFTDLDHPYIILYIPIYDIPIMIRRKYTDIQKKIMHITKIFFDQMDTESEKVNYMNFTGFIYKIGVKKLPHFELVNIINKINQNVSRVMHRRYLLISHCPIDFHLYKHFKSFQLLESYTGKVKIPEQFGEKVFRYAGEKVTSIPFTSATHLLFGDSIHIQGIVKRSDRKKIIEHSLRMNWKKKNENMILDDIKKLNMFPINMITSIKL